MIVCLLIKYLKQKKCIYLNKNCQFKNEGIKLIKKLAVPHTNLYYIEDPKQMKRKCQYIHNLQITQPTTDIYDSIKYLTIRRVKDTLKKKHFSIWGLWELYFGHILNPRAREERQKDFKKGKEMLCDYVFRETPTPNFYELIFNLTHFSWHQ